MATFFSNNHQFFKFLIKFNGEKMKIISIFNKNGKTLQEIIEQYLIEYCLDIGPFNNN